MPVPVPVPVAPEVAPLAVAPPPAPLPVAVWVLVLPLDDATVVAGGVAAVDGVAGVVGAWAWADGVVAGRTLGTLSTALGTWRVTGIGVDVELAGAVAVELTTVASSFGPGATMSGRRSTRTAARRWTRPPSSTRRTGAPTSSRPGRTTRPRP